MKILCISDNEQSELYESWNDDEAEKLKDVGMILSAGDLSPEYLEFLETMLNVPLLYVRGNHDSRYDEEPPQGCMGIDDKIVDVEGLRIAGLGGSICYSDMSNVCGNMYTEEEMAVRVRKLRENLFLKNLLNRKDIDILLTHSPASGHGDLEDMAHHGYQCFNEVLMDMKPAYHIYGHVHMEYGRLSRESTHPAGTEEINVSGMYVFEI